MTALAEDVVDAATGVTYLIGAVARDMPIASGVRYDAVKIGRSTEISVQSRLRSLQTGNPLPLEIVALIEGAEVEARLHAEFSDTRMNGEWFALAHGQIARIRSRESMHDTDAQLVHWSWRGNNESCPCSRCVVDRMVNVARCPHCEHLMLIERYGS